MGHALMHAILYLIKEMWKSIKKKKTFEIPKKVDNEIQSQKRGY